MCKIKYILRAQIYECITKRNWGLYVRVLGGRSSQPCSAPPLVIKSDLTSTNKSKGIGWRSKYKDTIESDSRI